MAPNHRKIAGMVDLADRLELQNLMITGLRRIGAAADGYKTLSLNEEQKMVAAEALAERMQRGHRCNVQIDCVSLLGKLYLNARYGLQLHVGSSVCDAVTSKAYVQSTGSIYPCQDVANASVGGPIDSTFRDAAVRNAAIANSICDLGVFANYTPCRSCPALGKLCTPCPLPGLRGAGHPVQGACVIALQRAKQHGIDLSAALAAAYDAYLGERLVASPECRRDFFSRDPSIGTHGSSKRMQENTLHSSEVPLLSWPSSFAWLAAHPKKCGDHLGPRTGHTQASCAR